MKHAIAGCIFLISTICAPGFAADSTSAIDPSGAQPSYLFLGKDAQTIISDALVRAGAGDSVRVRIEGAREEDMIANAEKPINAQADGLDFDKGRKSWQATLLLKAGDRNLAPVKLSGRYDEMSAVPVLKRALHNGEVIGEEDIEWSQQPLTHMRKSTITDAKELIGKSPRRMISEGRPIREEEIASPSVIAKGAHITLSFHTRSIEISTLGEAMDSGAKGDVIRVKNLASKTVVQGTVESGSRVRVNSPDTDTAEAIQ